MPARRAAAEEPQPLPMGMSLLMRRDSGITFAPLGLEDFAVGGEDQMIFQAVADFLIASGGGDGEVGAGRASMVM